MSLVSLDSQVPGRSSPAGLLSTFTRALHSAPFPSPLGAEFPPAGRFEGAVLGIGALGPNAVRDALWGTQGEKLDVIDNLVGVLYPGDTRKGKTPLMKVSFKLLATLIRPKPTDVPPPPTYDDLVVKFGPNVARALDKRPWMATELVRLHREGDEKAQVPQEVQGKNEDEDEAMDTK